MNETKIPHQSIPLSQLRKVTTQLRNLSDDTQLSLEFILTALFPSVWDNIIEYGNDCYTQGYIQGTTTNGN